MTDTLTALLLQLSEGSSRLLWGRVARPHFGPTFDRLLADGVLVERPPAEEWSTCRHCDCGFDVRPIQRIGNRIVAACPFDVSSDTELEEDDLRDFRIDLERLVTLVAGASGFETPPESLAPDLWRLGRLASGRSVVVGITGQVLDHPAIVLLLKAAGGGAPITVLVPDPGPAIRLRLVEAGIDFVELRSALMPTEGAVDCLDPARVEPLRAGPDGEPELIVRRGSGAIEWRGRSIGFTQQQFPVLLRLLEGTRSRSRVASGSLIEAATGREARDLIRELRQRVEAAGLSGSDAKRLFRAVHGRGYVLGVAPERIVVLD